MTLIGGRELKEPPFILGQSEMYNFMNPHVRLLYSWGRELTARCHCSGNERLLCRFSRKQAGKQDEEKNDQDHKEDPSHCNEGDGGCGES